MKRERYKRLEIKDLNDEGCLMLAEMILTELRLEKEAILHKVRIHPENKDNVQAAKDLYKVLSSSYIDILSMGHGAQIVEEFENQCPKGVLFDDGSRANESQKRKPRSDIGKPRKAIGDQSVIVGNG